MRQRLPLKFRMVQSITPLIRLILLILGKKFWWRQPGVMQCWRSGHIGMVNGSRTWALQQRLAQMGLQRIRRKATTWHQRERFQSILLSLQKQKIQKSLLKQLVRIAYGCVIQSLSTIIPFNLRIIPIKIGQIKAEQRICTQNSRKVLQMPVFVSALMEMAGVHMVQ
jgi:hypothetical protein